MTRQPWSEAPAWRKNTIIGLALTLVALVIGMLFFTSSVKASAGCGVAESNVKTVKSFSGIVIAASQFRVRWCWEHGQVKDTEIKIPVEYKNCIFGWCYNTNFRKEEGGYFTSPDHHKKIVTGKVVYCQNALWFDCAFTDSSSYGGWIKPQGESSFPRFSGGGGGGSW